MDRTGRRATLVLAAMTVANAMVLVDQTAVPLTLSEIMRSFDVGSQAAQWVLNGSLLMLSALLVLGGQISDLFGRRRAFVIGTVAFALASAGAALAPQFWMLIGCRLIQGAGGALLLPTTVALVSATFAVDKRGSALGTMGGLAAVAGAAGPVIGGVLTATLGWPAVFMINLPLAVVTVAVALTSVPRDAPAERDRQLDLPGAALLAVAIASLIVGLGQSQAWGWGSPAVWGLLVLAVAVGVGFVLFELRTAAPLVDLRMLVGRPNYRTAVISQALGGAAEMGLGVILPLLLILNLGMSPGVAGIALLPASLPLIFVAPLVGRWYDRSGARPPLVAGYSLLAVAGVLLGIGGFFLSYWPILPGLLSYGLGLAIVLTVNDPVSLSDVPDDSQGQAAGVAATAEQFGGALGLALLYLVFHTTYTTRLHTLIAQGALGSVTEADLQRLRDDLFAAETTGLHPRQFDPLFEPYLRTVGSAASLGYAAAFLGVTVIGAAGIVLGLRVRRVRNAASLS